MSGLRAVFRKEWTEARRDPRAWLLTLVVPILFYPGVVLVGLGRGASDELSVDCRDPRLAAELAGLPGLRLSGTGEEADLQVGVAARDPGFPERGSLWLDYRSTGGGLLAEQRFEQLLDDWGRRVARERALRAGLDERAFEPIRRVSGGPAVVEVRAGSALTAYLLVFLLFTGSLATAVDTGAGERERGGMEALLATPVDPLQLAAGKVGFILLTGIASVVSSLVGLTLAASVGGGLPGAVGAGPAAAGPVILLLLACGGLIASWLFACSLGARSAREAHAWISGLFLLVSLGLIWVTFGGGGRVAWGAWLPLFGAARAIGAVIDGGPDRGQWVAALLSTTGGGLAGLALCVRLLRREAVLRAW